MSHASRPRPEHHSKARNTNKSWPKTARHLAFDVLLRVEETDAYANLLLPKLIDRSELDARDAAFATELVYGTLRQSMLYDACIAAAAKREPASLDTPVRILLRLAAHQLLSMRVPHHATVDETVRLATQVGLGRAKGFVNAVARRLSERDRAQWIAFVSDGKSTDERLALKYSHPVWIIGALRRALSVDGRPDDLDDLLHADNEQPIVQATVLPGVGNRDRILERGATPATWSPISVNLPGGDPRRVLTPGSRVQDQGSALAALALVAARSADQTDQHSTLPPQPERWLDVCAGPGGKAAVLAASRGQSMLECNELQPHRAELVREALREAHVTGVPVHVGDGVDLLRTHEEHWDRILLDAPCTGLGALRRRPEARYRKHPHDVQELMVIQRALLESGYRALRPGGILAYVTCSPHIGETVNQVSRLLKRFPDAQRLDANAVLTAIAPGIPLGNNQYGAQLWPHVHQSDAMFISLIQKPLMQSAAG